MDAATCSSWGVGTFAAVWMKTSWLRHWTSDWVCAEGLDRSTSGCPDTVTVCRSLVTAEDCLMVLVTAVLEYQRERGREGGRASAEAQTRSARKSVAEPRSSGADGLR